MKASYWVIGVLIVLLSFSIYHIRQQDGKISDFSTHASIYIDSLNTYRTTYPSSDFELLKRENKLLYDELKDTKENITEVVRWKTRIQYVDSGKVREVLPTDSLFVFNKESDTISYKLGILAPSIARYDLDFTLNNQFTIIKREDGKGNNQLDITSGMKGEISDVTTWSKKDKKPSRWSVGVGVGYGYGFLHNNFDVYGGVSVQYKIFR